MARTASQSPIRTREQDRVDNEIVGEYLLSNDPANIKKASDLIEDFTRIRVREEGFFRKMMDPVKISNADLDRQVWTDKPSKVIDKEPGSPAAISIPFGTLPTGFYVRGSRYLVSFDRIVTPKFSKDVDELRDWIMDIRQVMSDNAIKDMLAEEDSRFMQAFNGALIGPDQAVPWSGVSQWQTISGGITRDTLYDAKSIMPKTDSHLEVDVCVINNVTINQIMKFGRDEFGGDLAQDVFRKGWTETNAMNMRWIITIKRDLIQDDSFIFMADPKFVGKSFLLEDTSMYVKREAYMMEWFAYATLGATIAHTGGLARADFA